MTIATTTTAKAKAKATDVPVKITVDTLTLPITHVVTFTTNVPTDLKSLLDLAEKRDPDTEVTVTPVVPRQDDVILAMFDMMHAGKLEYASPKEMGAALNRITNGTSKTPEGRVSQVRSANRNRPSIVWYREYEATNAARIAAIDAIKSQVAVMVKAGVPQAIAEASVAQALAALDGKDESTGQPEITSGE